MFLPICYCDPLRRFRLLSLLVDKKTVRIEVNLLTSLPVLIAARWTHQLNLGMLLESQQQLGIDLSCISNMVRGFVIFALGTLMDKPCSGISTKSVLRWSFQEDAVVKAGVAQFKVEAILPINAARTTSATWRSERRLRKLHRGDQREPSCCFCGVSIVERYMCKPCIFIDSS